MEKCNLTKVHCWSFAHSKGSYKPNQKVCFDQTEDALKVISKQEFSIPGIKNCIDVCPNTCYTLSVRGYADNNKAFLRVQDSHTKKRLICDYIYLPCEDGWVCATFNTGCATRN